MERTRTHNLAVGSVCKLRAETLPTQPPRHHRRQHSTETAVLKIVSDLLLACDRGQVSLLALLDLSAAFDTVDHSILIDRLQSAFGIRGPVIEWIHSFVTSRMQSASLAQSPLGQPSCAESRREVYWV